MRSQCSQFDAHQALGEDAVERGDEVISLDAHVEEAAEHVDHVVGVDGGEDQVAGERGVDGDLRGFLVADFADHDSCRDRGAGWSAGRGRR